MNAQPPKFKPLRYSADAAALDGEGLLIIKLGFFWHSLRGLWEFFKYTRLIQSSTAEASKLGLYSSEYFLYSQNHAGLIQYWRSFADIERWALHNPNHKAWWQQMETKGRWADLSIYHEVFCVPKDDIETVYNLHPSIPKAEFPGLLSFLPANPNPPMRARSRFLKPRPPEVSDPPS